VSERRDPMQDQPGGNREVVEEHGEGQGVQEGTACHLLSEVHGGEAEALHSSGHGRMSTEDGKTGEANEADGSAFRQFGWEEAFEGRGSRASAQEETEEGGKDADRRGILNGGCGYTGGDQVEVEADVSGYHPPCQGSGVAKLPAAATGGGTRGEQDCVR